LLREKQKTTKKEKSSPPLSPSMGNRTAKPPEPEPWAPPSSFTPACDIGIIADTANLERSGEEDRQHNSMGLPGDVLGEIFARSQIKHLGAFCLVCRTWRRVIIESDSIWRSIAKRDRLDTIDYSQPIRAQVVDYFDCFIASDFFFLPPPLSGRMAKPDYSLDRQDYKTVHVARSGSSAKDDRAWCRPRNPYAFDIITSINDHCEVFIFCSQFRQPNRLFEIEKEIEHIRKTKKTPIFLIERTESDLHLPFREKRRVLSYCEQNKIPFFCTSAMYNTNVDMMYETAAEMLERAPKE
jgi:hypothetical protein